MGFVGVDNQGLEGIEAMMDDTLTGSDGYILAQYDSHGQEITGSNRSYVDPENGDSIVLTIDENIQYFCERELDQLMNGTVNPKGAAIVMMEAKTGELLALAVRPDYDPNAYGDYDSRDVYKRQAEDYQAIVDDMNAAVAVLEPLATNEEETEEETAAEEEETTDDTATSTEETPSDVLATANQLITTAQSLLDDSGTSGAEGEE